MCGLASAIQDKISFRWDDVPTWMKKRDSFWNPVISWKNKWKEGLPENGERFFGSSTFLVCFTDGWHLMKEVMISSICISLSMCSGMWWMYIVFRLLFFIGFLYYYVKENKN